MNNYALGKISEVQYVSYNSNFAQTTFESGYSVPDFEKIAVAYGIKAATLDSYDELTDYKDWLEDDEPCLLNISIPTDSRLIPKINWESGEIRPRLDAVIVEQISEILNL